MTTITRTVLGLAALTALTGCGLGRSAQMTLAEVNGQWFAIPQSRSAEALANPSNAEAIVAEERLATWDARPHIRTNTGVTEADYAQIACTHPDAPCFD